MYVWIETLKRMEAIEKAIKDGLEGTPAAALTAKQVHVLAALYVKDGQTATDLAAAIGLAATSFTPILDAVQDAGFLLRRPHPSDRRSVQVFLTANGEALKPRIEKVLYTVDEKFASAHKPKVISRAAAIQPTANSA